MWIEFSFAGSDVKIGTPFVFDIGVYLLVLGIAFAFVVNLQEIDHDAELESLDSEDQA